MPWIKQKGEELKVGHSLIRRKLHREPQAGGDTRVVVMQAGKHGWRWWNGEMEEGMKLIRIIVRSDGARHKNLGKSPISAMSGRDRPQPLPSDDAPNLSLSSGRSRPFSMRLQGKREGAGRRSRSGSEQGRYRNNKHPTFPLALAPSIPERVRNSESFASSNNKHNIEQHQCNARLDPRRYFLFPATSYHRT